MIKDLVERLWPLHRTLVSDGTDEALRIVGEAFPDAGQYHLETFAPGTKAWTWTVPERYVVDEAYVETEDGTRVIDFDRNPLHLVSYSLPIDREMSWDELAPHLHVSESRPAAIPWEFAYYERTWGFCLAKDAYDRLPRDRRYRAVIRSRFVTDAAAGLRVGVGRIAPEGGASGDAGEVLVCTHVCHVRQANDDASGVASAIEVARQLAHTPLPAGSMSVRFLFVPETIGSICYLSAHDELIPRLKGAMFLEMTGNRNGLKLQLSRQGDHLIDRIARQVCQRVAPGFEEGAFRTVINNDEMVINGPGVNVPCISLSRWPYPEYHTSDDDPTIIFEDMLQQAADVATEVVRVFATNYVPRRTFRGPIFLSGHGLWVDWRTDPALNRGIERIMLSLDGDQSVFDIAERAGLDYGAVRAYVERFRERRLIHALPIPGLGQQA